jgi:branched-chain amino acid transport system substrate-binding protein
VEAIKTLDDAKLADYLREHVFTTVVGDVKFGAKGESAQTRIFQVQFQNTKGSDIAQFKDMTQVEVTPTEYASGEIIYPYERAK